MIPKILHYYFGLSADFGGKPWSLAHHVCLKSAVERIKPRDVLFYCEYEPTGPWWELSRRLVDVEKVAAPQEVFGNPLRHPAHRADVMRLEKLLGAGGIYLDTDVLVHRSFDDLLGHSAVLGEQRVGSRLIGLCNAVILAEADAPFLRRWHSEYRSFRSVGHDAYWDEHSVRIPSRLAKQCPGEVTVLPHDAFFFPSCDARDIRSMFASVEPVRLSESYATHLWESCVWERYLEQLTPKRVRACDTNFHYWIRPMIATLPDDYGTAPWPDRLRRGIRQLRRLPGRVLSRVGAHPRKKSAIPEASR